MSVPSELQAGVRLTSFLKPATQETDICPTGFKPLGRLTNKSTKAKENKAMMWTQYTYKNGELAYDAHHRTPDEMLDLFAQLHILKQAGEDIEVHRSEVNGAYQTIRYCVNRETKGGLLTYVFCREDDPSILWRDTKAK